MNARQDDPTPEQIAAMCKLIQAEWSPAERERRLRFDWRSTQDNKTSLQPTTLGTK